MDDSGRKPVNIVVVFANIAIFGLLLLGIFDWMVRQ